jgi:hypothetical protein
MIALGSKLFHICLDNCNINAQCYPTPPAHCHTGTSQFMMAIIERARSLPIILERVTISLPCDGHRFATSRARGCLLHCFQLPLAAMSTIYIRTDLTCLHQNYPLLFSMFPDKTTFIVSLSKRASVNGQSCCGCQNDLQMSKVEVVSLPCNHDMHRRYALAW